MTQLPAPDTNLWRLEKAYNSLVSTIKCEQVAAHIATLPCKQHGWTVRSHMRVVSSPGQKPGPMDCAAMPRDSMRQRKSASRSAAASTSMASLDHSLSATAAARGLRQRVGYGCMDCQSWQPQRARSAPLRRHDRTVAAISNVWTFLATHHTRLMELTASMYSPHAQAAPPSTRSFCTRGKSVEI